MQPVAHWALGWSAERQFGLVHIIALPMWAEFALSFLLMDALLLPFRKQRDIGVGVLERL